MNYRMILRTTGLVMMIEASVMAIMTVVALCYREAVLPFLIPIAILLAAGIPLFRLKPKQGFFFAKEGYVTAALTWLVLSAFGAVPFRICGGFGHYVNCFFEAVSGFTTTGSTILSEIESLPKSILLWRSTTHLLGGMGILVLASALISSGSDRSMHLMRAEMPGPTAGKLVPKLIRSNQILYGIYLALILLEIICLRIAGVSVYECINLSFSTAGTGGFAVTNDSIASYSAAVENILSIFMLLFSINFTMYFLALTGKFKQIIRNREFLLFVGIAAFSVFSIGVCIRNVYSSFGEGLRHALFTVAATASTTGFVVTDYDLLWPTYAKTIILVLTAVGACAGSTGGGVKVSRVYILLKSTGQEIRRIIHPRSVSVIRVDDGPADEEMVHGVQRFLAAYCACIIVGLALISLNNFDFTTSFSSVMTCLGNVGPGLGACGPVMNFQGFSIFSKLVLSILMLIGRLEIFPILIFFSPSTWHKA